LFSPTWHWRRTFGSGAAAFEVIASEVEQLPVGSPEQRRLAPNPIVVT